MDTQTFDSVYNMLVTALDSGAIGYWASLERVVKSQTLPEGYTADDAVYLAPLLDGRWRLRVDTDEPEVVTLGVAQIERGLQAMHDKCPRNYGDMIAGEDDAETADVFVQCCLFGEIVFG